jgi:acetyl-CoA C-acetyltransferase
MTEKGATALDGEHQVDGARTALGHAYCGGSQFFAMWVVASEKP